MSSISLGPLVIPVALLPWIGAFLVAWSVALIRARGKGRPTVEPLLWWAALAGLAGARLGFVLRHFDTFSANWPAVFDIRDGGLWWPGALIAVLLVFALAPGFRNAEMLRERGIVGASGALAALPLLIITVALSPGNFPAPPVTLYTPEGEAVAFDELADGQTSLVTIWASWCPHCHRSMPVLEAGQHRHENVRFVLVNQGEDATTVNRYMEEHGFRFEHQLMDPHGRLSSAAGARGVPTTLVISAEGNVTAIHTGGLSQARVEDLLGPHR